jgi:GDP-L-fucose synthase
MKSSRELDLRNQEDVNAFFHHEKPDYVFLAAAKVGGIHANNIYRAEFLYDNLMIESNVINAAYKNGVKKLLFLGSSCIYPKNAPQPIKEEYFMTGTLEPTNEPYAIAKITGIKLCDAYRAQYGCNFISAMPTNLYGPNDNYNLETSHVLPALMRKFIEAGRKKAPNVTIWGTGTPRREFLHVDDFAEACYFLMQNYDEPGFINVGTGVDISIGELANKLKDITGFKGDIVYDASKPDGMARKLLDVSRMKTLGWSSRISLDDGLSRTFQEIKHTTWTD